MRNFLEREIATRNALVHFLPPLLRTHLRELRVPKKWVSQPFSLIANFGLANGCLHNFGGMEPNDSCLRPAHRAVPAFVLVKLLLMKLDDVSANLHLAIVERVAKLADQNLYMQQSQKRCATRPIID